MLLDVKNGPSLHVGKWRSRSITKTSNFVDTNTLAQEHIGTNLHMNHPSRQAGINTFSRLNGCVKRQVRSEMARFMMKMFRGVLMAGFRATTKQTRLSILFPWLINFDVTLQRPVISWPCDLSLWPFHHFRPDPLGEHKRSSRLPSRIRGLGPPGREGKGGNGKGGEGR